MANTVFENKVIEAKATDLLTTTVNARSLMTIDSSLAETEGMTKVINVYTYTGKVENLEDGEKNTTRGSIAFEPNEYKVKRAQQVFDYTDTQFMTDNNVVDMSLEGANALMANKMTEDFYAELAKVELEQPVAVLGYEGIVDAISKLNIEDESKLFVIIPNAWKADMRKDEDYKNARMGEVVYNGQVGTVAGIPVIATKALTTEAYVMTNEAVKLLMKKDVEVEQDRDVETKTNTVVLTTYYITALVNKNKACRIKIGA
jgi:hypothetical protein